MLIIYFPTKIGRAWGYSSTYRLDRSMEIYKGGEFFLSLNPRDLKRENNKEKGLKIWIKNYFLRNPP